MQSSTWNVRRILMSDNNRRYHDIMMKALLFLAFVWCKKLVILLKLEDSDGTSVSRWAVCVFCKPLRVLYLLWILSVVRIVITVWSVGLGARKLCVSQFSRTIVIPINLFCVADHILAVSLDTIFAWLLNLGTHIYGSFVGVPEWYWHTFIEAQCLVYVFLENCDGRTSNKWVESRT